MIFWHLRIVCTYISAKDLLKHRQKIIKLADQSELGWRMVAEYETNPIASDSDDEKRIYKAEARATRKMKAERGVKRGRWRGYPYRRFTNRRVVDNGQSDNGRVQGQQTKRPGLCFACGGPGHWKFECPSTKAASNTNNNKISSILNSFACKDIELDKKVSADEKCSLKRIQVVSKGEEMEVSPVGRLKHRTEKWKEITDDSYILDVIQTGYKVPFKSSPPTVSLRNNKSARENMSFVKSEVSKLLERGVVTEVSETPKVVNPLTVAYTKTGKPRLVLDCRHINQYLHTFKFKYEDIKVAEVMFEKGSFLFTFDLKSAYHSIDIFSNHRQYFGFCLQEGGIRKFYVFNSLPFGLATAGHIFTKVLRVVVAFWRSKGHKIIMFLDDGIGGSGKLVDAARSSTFARESLLDLGFLLANEKCQWVPVQQVTWLGYFIDMIINKIYVTEERIQRLEMAIDSVLYQTDRDRYSLIHVRALASVVGQIISLQNVIGKKVSLKTRQMYRCILSRASWNAPVIVSEEAKAELIFWRRNARDLNSIGKCLDKKSFYELCLFADASSSGYGGYIETNVEVLKSSDLNEQVGASDMKPPEVGKASLRRCLHVVDNNVSRPPEAGISSLGRCYESCEGRIPGRDIAGILGCTKNMQYVNFDKGNNMTKVMDIHVDRVGNTSKFENQGLKGLVIGEWDGNERLKSSTWRETETVNRVIKGNLELLRHTNIKVYSDNKNVQSVLQKGSSKADLQAIASEINNICELNDIVIRPEWIPRGDNQIADALSKCGDSDDWSINDQVFIELNTKWGPHTVDRFATHLNTKCKRFNSRFWVPGTEGIDGLDKLWSGELNWLVPPPRLILNCIQKIKAEEASATFVIPVWESATYWPDLIRKDGSFKSFIVDNILLPSRNIIVKGNGNNGIFGREQLSFKMIALKIRF